ncbi:DUF5017 domain-containing protein [Sphingobacterium sp. SGG-5]|uniref:DUF5017 domain-containing protein n=1 Tax=Sphingobacterium sp. SGG-5 TaxID=2710881 RepID=UPI0013EE2079|nr:DUF5017 domain-containing protein [Sphingobacterium sp. SGG-5]NGM63215.1 DUF5017 domain-containing protein [Sphingobacterium sp. SGG-5]
MKELFKKYLPILCILCTVVSCKDMPESFLTNTSELPMDVEEKPGALEFNVTVDPSSLLKVGEKVTFQFTGNAEVIAFYSGTFGNAYAYRDQDRFYDVGASLSFQSSKSPSSSNTQPNWEPAELFYSTDFNGDRSSPNAYTNVKAATWLPLTDRFELPRGTPQGLAAYVNSGMEDISDIFEGGGPVYLAWHCTTQAASNRVQFNVIESSIQGIVTDNPTLSTELYNQSQLNFQWVLNPAAANQGSRLPDEYTSATVLQWDGVYNNLSGPFKEGYAISEPLELPQFNAGRDTPMSIVGRWNNKTMKHTFTYDKAGEYEVAFIASHLGSEQEIIKTITINIEE